MRPQRPLAGALSKCDLSASPLLQTYGMPGAPRDAPYAGCACAGLLIVTENLLRPSEGKPLGLVCYPQPPSSECPEFPLQLTVQG